MPSIPNPPWLEHPAFYEAVQQATVAAEKNVAKVHRRRLVGWTAALTFIVTTAINIPVSAVISHDNARKNCGLITELAGVGAMHVGRERDKLVAAETRTTAAKERTARFKRESPDRLGLTPAQFDRLIGEQEAEQATQIVEEAEEAAEQRHRQKVLARVASHSCG